ncbi:MAG: hypothetical protein AAF560_01090 [Acidobacteriota bacterium]
MKHFTLFVILLLSISPLGPLAGNLYAQQPAPESSAKLYRDATSRAWLTRAPKAESLFDRPTYSFQVSLLLADAAGQGGYEGLSKNAQKALEDLRDFLPFKSYRLLDFAWLRTSLRSSARVQGPDGRDFELTLSIGDTQSEDTGRLYISGFDLRDTSTLNLDVEAGPLRRARSLISTSFAMEEGETVVVGTSRLEGDQRALIVLLTAVPTSLTGR